MRTTRVHHATQQIEATKSSFVPAARGQVEFNSDKSGNPKVKVKVGEREGSPVTSPGSPSGQEILRATVQP